MGEVFANFGAVTGAVETTYGTSPGSLAWIRTTDQPGLSFDEGFDVPEELNLNADFEPGERVKNALDIETTAIMTEMEDVIGGFPLEHAILLAGGCEVKAQGISAGSGNFIEYGPRDSGFGSATIRAYEKEDESGQLSFLEHLGTRGNWTLNVEPGAGNLINYAFSGKSRYGRRPEFADSGTIPLPVKIDRRRYQSKCVSATLEVSGGAQAIPIRSLSFSPNYAIVDAGDSIRACAAGIDEVQIEPAQMTGTLVLDYESDLISSSALTNFVKQFRDADVDAALVVTIDPGTGQTVVVTIPRFRAQDMQVDSGDTFKVWNIDFVAQIVSGQDNFTIRYGVT